jgi:hypothetical protein
MALGRGAAPVWWNPRRREETGRHTRAESEAGTRRRQGRWEPTQGEQQAQPSPLPGSGSADGRRHHEGSKNEDNLTTIFTQLLTLEVISTPGIRRA